MATRRGAASAASCGAKAGEPCLSEWAHAAEGAHALRAPPIPCVCSPNSPSLHPLPQTPSQCWHPCSSGSCRWAQQRWCSAARPAATPHGGRSSGGATWSGAGSRQRSAARHSAWQLPGYHPMHVTSPACLPALMPSSLPAYPCIPCMHCRTLPGEEGVLPSLPTPLQEWGFGLAEPSSNSTESSVGGGGAADDDDNGYSSNGTSTWGKEPVPAALPPAAKAVVAAGKRGGRPVHLQEGRPPPAQHPADWQWAWATRTARLLRPTAPCLAVVAVAAAAAGAWHQEAFP